MSNYPTLPPKAYIGNPGPFAHSQTFTQYEASLPPAQPVVEESPPPQSIEKPKLSIRAAFSDFIKRTFNPDVSEEAERRRLQYESSLKDTSTPKNGTPSANIPPATVTTTLPPTVPSFVPNVQQSGYASSHYAPISSPPAGTFTYGDLHNTSTYSTASAPPASFSEQILSRIQSKESVESLRRHDIDARRLISENISLGAFWDANYSIAEMATLLDSSYQSFVLLGLNKHLFAQKWSLVGFSRIVETPLRIICGDLNFTANEMLDAGLVHRDFVAMNMSALTLLDLGANSTFLLRLGITPQVFVSDYHGTFNELMRFKFTPEEKLSLSKTCGWTNHALTSPACGPLGMNPSSVMKHWMLPFKMAMDD